MVERPLPQHPAGETLTSVTSSEVVGPAVSGLTAIELDNCVNIFNPNTQRAVLLNETATAVWRLSDGTHRFDEIVAILAEQYSTTPDAIRASVRSAIEGLQSEALLETASEPDGGRH